MPYVYPVTLKADEAGGFVATFADVPEAITQGDTREEALAEAGDALAVAMDGYMQARRPVPIPSVAGKGQASVAAPTLVAAKLALYTAMREQGVSN